MKPSTADSVHSLQDLLLSIPAGLGYWPASSLVLVFLDRQSRVLLTARCDLSDVLDSPDGWRDYLTTVASQSGGHSCVLAIFDESPQPIWDAAATATEALNAAGVTLEQACVVVADGSSMRWGTALQSPSEGLSELRTFDHSAVEAAKERFGDWCDSRDQLVQELAPLNDSDESPQGQRGLDEAERDMMIGSIVAHLNAGESRYPDATLTQALMDVRVRDTVAWDLLQGDSTTWAEAAHRLVAMVRRAPDHAVAPVATLLALLRWQLGDGTRAVIALDRALAAHPDYTFAQLLMRSIESAIPPASWLEGLRQLSRGDCRRPA